MAESELERKELFTDFLLGAEVGNSYTFDEFKGFFPRKYQDHLDVKVMYNAYQTNRKQIRDKVMSNIMHHCSRKEQDIALNDGSQLEDAITELKEKERLLQEEIEAMQRGMKDVQQQTERCAKALETRNLFSGLQKRDFTVM